MNTAASGQESNDPRRFLRGLLIAILLVIPMMLFGQGYFGTRER